MSASQRSTSLIGGAMTAVAIALTAGAGLAAAAPSPSGASLSLCPDVGKPGYYRATIQGVFPMSEADAVGFLVHIDDNPAKPGGIRYYLQADDGNGHAGDSSLVNEFYPHAQPGGGPNYLRAGAGGLEYRHEFSVWGPLLDEDGKQFSWEPGNQDEVYATAKFVDADGGTRTQFSQQIAKDFTADHVCDGCCR